MILAVIPYNNLVPIISMDMSEDSNYLLVSCMDSKIRLFERHSGEVISIYKDGHLVKRYKAAIKFAKDNMNIFTTSETHNAVIYNIGTVF